MPDSLTLLRYGLLQQEMVTYGKWAALVLVTLLLIRAITGQNRQYRRLASDRQEDQGRQELLQAALVRGKVAVGLWVLLVVLLIYRDVEQQIALSQRYPDRPSSITPLTDAPAEPDTPPDAPETNKPGMPLEQSDQREATLDTIKAIYEDAFVSYMVLERCGRVGDAEYSRLNARLASALAPHDAPPALVENIIAAARGSYEMLYSANPCEDAELEKIETSFRAFLSNE